jgi:hypothetical protein
MSTFFNAPTARTQDPSSAAVASISHTNETDTLIRQMAAGNANATKQFEESLQEGGRRKNGRLYHKMPHRKQKGGNRTYDTVNVESAMTAGSISTAAPNGGLYVGQACVGAHCAPLVDPRPNDYLDFLIKGGDALNPEAITSAAMARLGNSTDSNEAARYTNFNPSYNIQCGAGRKTRSRRRKIDRRRRQTRKQRRN